MLLLSLISLLLFVNHTPLDTRAATDGVYQIRVKKINQSGRVERFKGKVYLAQQKIFGDFSIRNGFKKSMYEVSKENQQKGVVMISSPSINTEGNTLKWEVRLEGQKIQGYAKRNDTGTVYHFKGKLVNS